MQHPKDRCPILGIALLVSAIYGLGGEPAVGCAFPDPAGRLCGHQPVLAGSPQAEAAARWPRTGVYKPRDGPVNLVPVSLRDPPRPGSCRPDLTTLAARTSPQFVMLTSDSILPGAYAFLPITENHPRNNHAITGPLEARGLTAIGKEKHAAVRSEFFDSQDGHVMDAVPMGDTSAKINLSPFS